MKTRALLKNPHWQLALVLLLALALRLGQVVVADPWPDISGGDYVWYASVGSTLVRTGWTHGPPQTGPVFLLVAGITEQISPHPLTLGQPAWLLREGVWGERLFPEAVGGGRQLVRLLHALLSTLTVYGVYITGRTGWNHRVGLGAALLLAVNPIFIIEAGNLTTETISIFFLVAALAVWMARITTQNRRWLTMIAAGGLLGLAALTRAVFLAVPGVLLLHLLMVEGWRSTVKNGALLLLALAITLAPWTLYNLARWNRFVIAGEGLLGTLAVGAVGYTSAEAVDAAFDVGAGETSDDSGSSPYAAGLRRIILDDLPGYLLRRVQELGGALLQPHNTAYYPGESIRALFMDWLRTDRSPGGLLALSGADAFWPKLLLYIFHYGALILGAVGMWRARRDWRRLWPLYGLVAYVLALHLALAAIPRYLFPMMPVLWLFAAAAIQRTRDDTRILANRP